MTEPTAADGAALGLGDEFSANKAAPTAELAGYRIVLDDGRSSTEYVFDSADSLRWRPADGDAAFTTETYEALKPGDGVYLVAYASSTDDTRAVEMVIDVHAGRGLLLRQQVTETDPGVPSVAQTTELPRIALIDPSTTADPFVPIPRTEELTGVRALWEYSGTDVYEHIYLNSEWYVWHCLAGEEYPLADTDPCAIYKVRDDLYALTFSEKVLTMGALMVLDFAAMRSYCAAFGSGDLGQPAQHFLFGAYGRVLSRTVYPAPLTAGAAGDRS